MTEHLIRIEGVGRRVWDNFFKPAFEHLKDEDPAEWFRLEHGISSEVWEGRPYAPYTTEDLERVREAFKECAPNQQKWAENQAEKCTGFIMIQHAVPGLGLLPIPPQLRPFEAIHKGTIWHYHPLDAPPDSFIPKKPNGKPLPEERRSRAWAKRLHILRHEDHDGAKVAARLGYDTPEKLRQLVNDPACEEDLLQVLREANDEEAHSHEDLAKYLLTIKPQKRWVHDHADFKKPSKLSDHLKKWHEGKLIVGEHDHGDKEIEDDDPRRSPGKRIDIHPLAWKRFAEARVIYFLIEGKIKADATLSEILRLDLPASVCSVPSIGQWDAHELLEFAMRDLAGKIIVIVCDADGGDNPEVVTQALLLRRFLGDPSLGLRAVAIFSPPYEAFRENKAYKGQDDHLGVAGGRLDDLEMLGRKIPTRALSQWAANHFETVRNQSGKQVRPRVLRDLETMSGLSLLLGPGGQGQPSLKKVARFIGISDDRVEEAVNSLIKLGELDVDTEDKTLASARWQFRGKDYQDPNLGWEGRPTIKIVNPALRSADLPPERLDDWLKRKITEDPAWEESDVTVEERIEIVEALKQMQKAFAPKSVNGDAKVDAVMTELEAALEERWNAEAV